VEHLVDKDKVAVHRLVPLIVDSGIRANDSANGAHRPFLVIANDTIRSITFANGKPAAAIIRG
jgi:hypothetical protein